MALPQVYAQLITDQVSLTVTYVGYCMTDYTPTSAAEWAIYRITSASGTQPSGLTVIQSAYAPDNFNQVWDNRLTLTYV